MADIEITKIILRRGPLFDLPGKSLGYSARADGRFDTVGIDLDVDVLIPQSDNLPLIVEPDSPAPYYQTNSLLAGELAFASDEGRLFVGTDPDQNLKHSQRAAFPYRNVEVIGENSDAPFRDIHGERMREGKASDYYSAPLNPTGGAWESIAVSGKEDRPYAVYGDSVALFVHYTIHDQTGARIRYGSQQVQFFYNGLNAPQMIDEYEVGRSNDAEVDSRSAFTQMAFRFVYSSSPAPRLLYEYRNDTSDTFTIQWRVSRA